MRYFLTIILCLFNVLMASAQLTVEPNGLRHSSMGKMEWVVRVEDAKTKRCLSGAVVEITTTPDKVLREESKDDRPIRIAPSKVTCDSITVKVSCEGYETLEQRFPVEPFAEYLARMHRRVQSRDGVLERSIYSGDKGDSRQHYTVVVNDITGQIPMAGAMVEIACDEGDTLRQIVNSSGFADLTPNKRIKRDSIDVKVSYVGYKTLQRRFPVEYTARYEARMQIDSTAISAIIVQGNRIAMVQRGDTIIYNAGAFKTMRGDPLKNLLRKMPGLEVKDDRLYANGEPVSMILINGTTLFGRNVSEAMRLIRSDEVEKVRVFDEYDRMRADKADTLFAKKRRVVDVKTKKAITYIRDLSLYAEAGMFTDKGIDNKYESVVAVNADYSRFALKRPQLLSHMRVWKNQDNVLMGGTQPNRGAQFNLAYNDSRGKWKNELTAKIDEKESELRQENVYFPTEEFLNRISNQSQSTLNRSFDVTYMGSYAMRIKNRHILSIDGGVSYNALRASGQNIVKNEVDGLATSSDVKNRNSTSGYKIDLRLMYQTRRKKNQKGKLQASLGYMRNDGGSDGWRVDTLQHSTMRQWLTDESSAVSDNLTAQFVYNYMLSKKMTLNMSYTPTLLLSEDNRLAWDQLLMSVDKINTYHYCNDRLGNVVNLGLNIRLLNNAFTSSVNLKYNNEYLMRREYLPDEYRHRQMFDAVLPSVNFNYNKGAWSVSAMYNMSMTTPTIQQLRSVIDNSSPLYLSVGNPELGEMMNHSGHILLNYTDVAHATSYSIDAWYTGKIKSIVDKVQYFSSDTFLPEYDYTAVAGSTLTTYVNAGAVHDFYVVMGLTNNSSTLQSTFGFSGKYEYTQNPFMLGDVESINNRHGGQFTFNYNSGFSRVVELNLMSRTNVAWNFRDKSQLYRSISEYLNASLRVNFLKRMWVNFSLRYDYYNTTQQGMRNESLMFDGSMAYKFGKNDAGEISLICNDIFNRGRKFNVGVQNDYVRSVWDSIFGRSIKLRLSYKFNKR